MKDVKSSFNDWCWQMIQAKDIKPGNLITTLSAKTPRVISNVVIVGNEVTLFEKFNGRDKVYMNATLDTKFDLLVHQSTKVPVTEGEVYE